ncbi:MAG TPA: glycosyltransferase family 2 protein [bacterium]|nr:glycosyltransferase family 2 protein [bacterium]HPR89236.1 glycosyltransferase family 2 protein [bacterium]
MEAPPRAASCDGGGAGVALAAGPAEILIAVPACNEAAVLGDVITRIRAAAPQCALLVIDDGSQDGTPEVLQRLQLASLCHAVTRGKGCCLRDALAEARRRGCGWLITLDGDGQHDPAFLPRFLEAIGCGEADVLIGCRQGRAGQMPWPRRISNSLSSILVSCFSGIRFHDAQCGYRAMRVDLEGLAECREEGFQYESEVLLRLGRRRARFREIPISTCYSAAASRIRYGADTLRFLRLLWRSLWWAKSA